MYTKSVFLAGNLEAQRLSVNLSPDAMYLFVKRHFIYCCLLSERVFFPAANYFQSQITQCLVKDFSPLFRADDVYPQLVFVGINPSKEDFRGEALEKKDTYMETPDYICYMDDIIRDRLISDLKRVTEPYMRKGKLINSVNNYIIRETKQEGILNKTISKFTDSQEQTMKTLHPLISAVEVNEKAIIPEYVLTFDKDHVITTTSERMIRLSLLKAYTESLQDLYEAFVCNPLTATYGEDYLFPYRISYLDTQLFDYFLSMFDDLYPHIMSINAKQLRKIKYSARFNIFLKGYLKFVNEFKKKEVPIIEIKRQAAASKSFQDRIYVRTLNDVINNTQTAAIMYRSMFGIRAKIKKLFGRRIWKTDTVMALNEDVFLYNLVNEISETFLNKYNETLAKTVRTVYNDHRNRSKGIMFNKIVNNGGTQILASNISNSQMFINAEPKQSTPFVPEDLRSITKLADLLDEYQGAELDQTEKTRLTKILREIGEDSVGTMGGIEEKKENYKKVFSALKEIGQKTVISLATSVLSDAVLSFLEMGRP